MSDHDWEAFGLIFFGFSQGGGVPRTIHACSGRLGPHNPLGAESELGGQCSMTPGILLGWLDLSQGFYRRRNRHRAFTPLRKSPPSGDYPQITQIFADPEICDCVLFLAPNVKLSLTLASALPTRELPGVGLRLC